MKFLFLSQGRKIEDQPDFHMAFRNAIGENNYRNIPYLQVYDEGGWPHLEKTILTENESFRPDVIYFQFFHSIGCAHVWPLLKQLKATYNHPLILGSLGDLFSTGRLSWLGRPFPPSITELVAEADAFFSTSMGHTADELVRRGGKNIVFLPNAFCPEHFPSLGSESTVQYDVLMLGNVPRFLSRRPCVSVPTYFKRRYVVSRLSHGFGRRFAVYGHGWNGVSAHGGILFKDQVNIFRKSKVVVDSPPRVAEELYSSDRAYFIAGSGVSLVMPYTPHFELLFEPDRHVYYVKRLCDVVDVCKRVLALPEDVRRDRARLTVEYIRSRNLISHRVDTILSVIESIRRIRNGELMRDEALEHVRLWHFRPELDKKVILPFAIRNWIG